MNQTQSINLETKYRKIELILLKEIKGILQQFFTKLIKILNKINQNPQKIS